MPRPWALTSSTRLRSGIPARAPQRQTYVPPTRVSPQRCFTTSSRLNHKFGSGSFADPERPDLFYHLFKPPSAMSTTEHVFGLSFLETLKPEDVQSPRIIGYLPASEGGQLVEAGLNDFRENLGFREILHKAIREGLMEGVDEVQTNGARQLQEGWMHIHDERNIPPFGRIGDPDDIIASVRVQDGKVSEILNRFEILNRNVSADAYVPNVYLGWGVKTHRRPRTKIDTGFGKGCITFCKHCEVVYVQMDAHINPETPSITDDSVGSVNDRSTKAVKGCPCSRL